MKRNKIACTLSSGFIFLIIAGLSYFITQIKISEQQAIKAKDETTAINERLTIAIDENIKQSQMLEELPKEIIDSMTNDGYSITINNNLLTNPVVAIMHNNKFLSSAFKIYPNSKNIANQLYWNYFISMKFDRAKSF